MTSHNTTVDGKRVRSLTFNTWRGMIGRCRHPSHPHAETYAPLGVCPRWEHGENGMSGFECFLMDMGERPDKQHTLDRRKNEIGYHKLNCRWLDLKGQGRNKTNNKMVTYQGESMAFAEAYERAGKNVPPKSSVLYWIWKGHSFEAAILMPRTRAVRKRKKKVANG